MQPREHRKRLLITSLGERDHTAKVYGRPAIFRFAAVKQPLHHPLRAVEIADPGIDDADKFAQLRDEGGKRHAGDRDVYLGDLVLERQRRERDLIVECRGDGSNADDFVDEALCHYGRGVTALF